jgi:pilus assembly protein CpaB
MIKNRRALIALVAAVVLGFAAVALASRWMLRHQGSAATRIVVAASDVNLGQRLTPEMLRLAEWPAASLPQGAVTDPAKLAGRVVRTAVLRGEPVSEPKLAPAGTVGGLSALISEGKRAMTVRVNDVVGVAGFALPGNYVDILVHTERDDAAPDSKDRHISKLVLERMLVLAVAQEVGRDDTKPRVVNAVTLEVTPAEAEEIDLARSVGTLSLVLRNQVDLHTAATEGATRRSVLQLAKAAPPPKPAAARVRPALAAQQKECVAVISGAQATRECF